MKIIQVYTGEGKGKTTAALGAALRALGHGKKVLMIQFMKGSRHYGELKTAQRLVHFKIISSGNRKFVNRHYVTQKDREDAQRGFTQATQIASSNKYDLLILDELNVAIHFGLIKLDDVLKFLKNMSKNLDIIITGRYAHPSIIKMADLVSEMREIKHHFKKGLKARQGIEY